VFLVRGKEFRPARRIAQPHATGGRGPAGTVATIALDGRSSWSVTSQQRSVHRMRERARCLWSGLIPAAAVLVLVLTAAGASPPLPSLEHRASPQRVASGPASSIVRTAAPSSPSTTFSRIQEQLAARRRRLAELLAREQRALAQFSGAQERLERAFVQLKRTSRSLAGTQQAVLSASRTLEAVTTRLSTHEVLMGGRLRAFYEEGPLGYVDVLLGAADFRDLMTRSYLVARIVESDLALYHRV